MAWFFQLYIFILLFLQPRLFEGILVNTYLRHLASYQKFRDGMIAQCSSSTWSISEINSIFINIDSILEMHVKLFARLTSRKDIGYGMVWYGMAWPRIYKEESMEFLA